jgi:hypothetical protein
MESLRKNHANVGITFLFNVNHQTSHSKFEAVNEGLIKVITNMGVLSKYTKHATQ